MLRCASADPVEQVAAGLSDPDLAMAGQESPTQENAGPLPFPISLALVVYIMLFAIWEGCWLVSQGGGSPNAV